MRWPALLNFTLANQQLQPLNSFPNPTNFDTHTTIITGMVPPLVSRRRRTAPLLLLPAAVVLLLLGVGFGGYRPTVMLTARAFVLGPCCPRTAAQSLLRSAASRRYWPVGGGVSGAAVTRLLAGYGDGGGGGGGGVRGIRIFCVRMRVWEGQY